MNDSGSERSSNPWNMYTNPDPTSSQMDREWRSSFGTSMNAISFGFVATAILISMFLVMAIFEHLFRPSPFASPEDGTSSSLESGTSAQKLQNPQRLSTSYASDLSVLMPGQQCPTYIAQPAPLPCPRETISWPLHNQQNFVHYP